MGQEPFPGGVPDGVHAGAARLHPGVDLDPLFAGLNPRFLKAQVFQVGLSSHGYQHDLGLEGLL
jgi:hypothetical protein